MTKLHYIFLFVFLASCNYAVPNRPQISSGNQTIEKLPTGTIPGYQTIATEIIAPKCLGCHSSGGGSAGGVNLETYANVKGHLAAISSEVTSGSMPKNISPLSAKEKEVFLAWIDAGGPLDSMTPATGPTTSVPSPAPTPTPKPTPNPADVMPDPNKIDYQMVSTRVIGPRCISCHSDGGGNQAGINLETYESVFNERSGIKRQITNGSMPLPRSRPLTDIQKQIFLTWLNKGAPEIVP
ncbi:MAG: hypothetical protein ACXVLQ_09045 [Bacteriovorax sp.]